MATFVMLGRYSGEGMKGITAERTTKANELVKKYGGEVLAAYALLGDTDLVFVIEFPRKEQAMQASVALTKLTGIGFTTSPAVSVDDFDKLMSEV